jgi:hypothetical protein
MNGYLAQLLQAYNQRLNGVDKPQFYNAWEPTADPQMQLTPNQSNPAFGDRMIMRPDDVPPPQQMRNGYQDFSALSRLINGFG